MSTTSPGHPTGNLDDVVHQRHRLGILAVAAEADRVEFSYLKDTLELTAGNLSRHLGVLENAKLLALKKDYAWPAPSHLDPDHQRGPKSPSPGNLHPRSARQAPHRPPSLTSRAQGQKLLPVPHPPAAHPALSRGQSTAATGRSHLVGLPLHDLARREL